MPPSVQLEPGACCCCGVWLCRMHEQEQGAENSVRRVGNVCLLQSICQSARLWCTLHTPPNPAWTPARTAASDAAAPTRLKAQSRPDRASRARRAASTPGQEPPASPTCTIFPSAHPANAALQVGLPSTPAGMLQYPAGGAGDIKAGMVSKVVRVARHVVPVLGSCAQLAAQILIEALNCLHVAQMPASNLQAHNLELSRDCREAVVQGEHLGVPPALIMPGLGRLGVLRVYGPHQILLQPLMLPARRR